MAGCEAQGKAQGLPRRLGVTGEGNGRKGEYGEPSLMPRYGNSPGRTCGAGEIKRLAAESRQTATEDSSTVVWIPSPPGSRGRCDTRSQVVSGLCVGGSTDVEGVAPGQCR